VLITVTEAITPTTAITIIAITMTAIPGIKVTTVNITQEVPKAVVFLKKELLRTGQMAEI